MLSFHPWLYQKEKYKVKKKLPRQNQVASAIACRGTFFLIQRAEFNQASITKEISKKVLKVLTVHKLLFSEP